MTATSRSGGDRRSSGGDDPFPIDEIPENPFDVGTAESQVWRDVLDRIPHQMLRGIDVYQLQTLVETLVAKDTLYSAWKADPEDLPTFRAYNQASQQLQRLSVQYGLSPVDRKKITIVDEEQDDAAEWMTQE